MPEEAPSAPAAPTEQPHPFRYPKKYGAEGDLRTSGAKSHERLTNRSRNDTTVVYEFRSLSYSSGLLDGLEVCPSANRPKACLRLRITLSQLNATKQTVSVAQLGENSIYIY